MVMDSWLPLSDSGQINVISGAVPGESAPYYIDARARTAAWYQGS
jgi:hypothetical protein